MDAGEHGGLSGVFRLEDLVSFVHTQGGLEPHAGSQQCLARRAKLRGDILVVDERKRRETSQDIWRTIGCHRRRPQLGRSLRLRGGQASWGMDEVPRESSAGFQHAATFSQHGELVTESAEHVGVDDRVARSGPQGQGASVAAHRPVSATPFRGGQRLPGHIN